jgi:hypothetical protein
MKVAITFIMGCSYSNPVMIMPMPKVSYLPPLATEVSLLPKLWEEVDLEVGEIVDRIMAKVEATKTLDDWGRAIARHSCTRVVLEELRTKQLYKVLQLRKEIAPLPNPSEDLKNKVRWESDKFTCFCTWQEWSATLPINPHKVVRFNLHLATPTQVFLRV